MSDDNSNEKRNILFINSKKKMKTQKVNREGYKSFKEKIKKN